MWKEILLSGAETEVNKLQQRHSGVLLQKVMLKDSVELVCILVKVRTKRVTIVCLGETLGWIFRIGNEV